jgi:hypothetical protein
MRDLFILVVHVITAVFRLARPGGLRAVVAESRSNQTSDVDPESFASTVAPISASLIA